MCELFGYSGSAPGRLNDLLTEFFAHSCAHPDGWGLAVPDGGHMEIEKEPLQASRSEYLLERLREPVISPLLLAHIRYATIGNVERRNCHPFTGFDNTGRQWTLVHNGTIFDYPAIYPYSSLQKGDTDSERILLYILDLVNTETARRGRPLTDLERFDLLDRLMVSLSEGNKLNLLLYDSSLLYVHINQKEGLHYCRREEGTVFSTRPLFPDLWDWQPVPSTRLSAWKDGRQVLSGTDHHHFFMNDEEKMRLLYLSFSGL